MDPVRVESAIASRGSHIATATTLFQTFYHTPRLTSSANQRRRFSLLRLIGLASLFATVQGQLFSARIGYKTLNGTTGFVLYGDQGGDHSGNSVSIARDVNGDGIPDFLIGAPSAQGDAGKTYLLFGRNGLEANAPFELSNLNRTFGMVINGDQQNDNSGFSVSGAGDVNGDGVPDILIGAPKADTSPPLLFSGKAYVVFGKQGLEGPIELSTLNATSGVEFISDGKTAATGHSVAIVDDINGDTVADILVSAPGYGPSSISAGRVYVVFGGKNLGAAGPIDLTSLNGTLGFIIDGEPANDYQTGFPVASAGDVNDDGIADILIGIEKADPGGRVEAGKTYVVFGRAGLGGGGSVALSSLDGTSGFVINGASAGDQSGYAVAGNGDVNGDGVADLVIGAPLADIRVNSADRLHVGKTYVIFGKKSLGSSGVLELTNLDAASSCTINSDVGGGRSGVSVSIGGDVNGDGIADLLIGADGSRRTYVVFGKTGLKGSLLLSTLNGTAGFVLDEDSTIAGFGRAVSNSGDVNGDGIADILVGANAGDLPPDRTEAGISYMLFGRKSAPSTGTSTSTSGGITDSMKTSPSTLSSSAGPLLTTPGISSAVSQSPGSSSSGRTATAKTSPSTLSSLSGPLLTTPGISSAVSQSPESSSSGRTATATANSSPAPSTVSASSSALSNTYTSASATSQSTTSVYAQDTESASGEWVPPAATTVGGVVLSIGGGCYVLWQRRIAKKKQAADPEQEKQPFQQGYLPGGYDDLALSPKREEDIRRELMTAPYNQGDPTRLPDTPV